MLYALRQLRKSPAFTLTVLITLGLCIGANTAIFSIVDRLFFRPLPYPKPDRLALVVTTMQRAGHEIDLDTSLDGRGWEAVRDHAPSLEAGVYSGTSGVNLVAAGQVQYVQQQRVSAGYFRVLGVNPLVGREFTQAEDVTAGPAVAILSFGLWQRLFRGQAAIVGHTVDLRGAPFTVVGIMPNGFRTDQAADLWTPIQPSTHGEGGGDNYGVIARLKPGATAAQADAELVAAYRPIVAERHFPTGVTMVPKVIPLQAGFAYDVGPRLKMMWAAAALVLLIGCVNIAGLLLARAAARSREIATRLAIGATRSRIIGQLLWESLLLAAAGGIVGIFVGRVAMAALLRFKQGFEIWDTVTLDARVMAATMGAALATSIVFGLLPAFEATAVDLRWALSEAGRGATARSLWKRQVLVFAEVALGVVLVVSAGLLIRTLATLTNANPSFNPEHVMTASLSLQDARYETSKACNRLFRDSLERVQAIPGVESAAVTLTVPYQRPLNMPVQQITGRDMSQVKETIANWVYATPDMFKVLEIPLLRGRTFTVADNEHSAKVAVANAAFVNYFIKNGDPVGVHVNIGGGEYQIIGVVASVPQRNGMGGSWGPVDKLPQVYLPAAQLEDGGLAMIHTWFSPNWIVRTRGDVPGLAKKMSDAVKAVDPRLPFSEFHSMAEMKGASMREQRYLASLFSALAGLALLLVALGLYGLVAQSVVQRTREMGIRLALGATMQGILQAATSPGVRVAVAGVAVGIVVSLFVTKWLASELWGVTATDPLTFVSVSALMITVTLAASLIPSLRLTRLDPAQALRDE